MKNERIGYSSVMGALHEKCRLPNQDSYLIKRYKFGTLLVVSDGMGSHKHSDIGSHSICRAVSEAIQLWNNKKCDDIRLLIPLLHSIWGLDIFPYSKNECGATCLFAYINNDNKLYLGQLGDGSIFFDVGSGIELFKEKEDDFANLTTGINNIKNYSDWTLASFPIYEKGVKICIMTDGVSETLIDNKSKEFVKLLWKRASEANNTVNRNNLVYKLLKNWNPVNSGDDRTLICYERI